MSDDEAEYGLVMPFVTVKSKGGPQMLEEKETR